MTTILFIALAVSIVIGVPVTFALGIASAVAIAVAGLPMLALPQRMLPSLSDNFSIIAIPLFILAGNIIGRGGLGDRLIRLANILVGRTRGALASTNIVASMLFGGISGSATADTSALGTVLIPAMVKEGYSRAFATAVTVVSSPLGTIIPPSIIIIVYCWVTESSVAAMFAAGYLPGLLIGSLLIITGYIISVRRRYPLAQRFSIREKIRIILEALPGMFTIVIIIGGIVGGIFTATEAGAVAVVYGFIISRYYYKSLKFSDLPDILLETTKLTGIVTLILGMAGVFGWLIAFDRVPYQVAAALSGVSPEIFLPAYILLLIILGTFLAPTEALIIVVPILYPVATILGIHPFHFGMVTITSLALGHITPPVGLCLFVGSAVSGLSINAIVRAMLPFYVASVVAVMVIAYFPIVSTWFPEVIGY